MRVVICGLLAGLFSVAAPAQDYPNRPIRVLVGFAPGGGADLTARAVAQAVNEAWKVPGVVDNRPGAGGNVAAEIAARANPDGYTLLATSPGPVAVNQSLYAKLAYDPVKDFVPITLVGASANVLVVHPGLGVKSVKELIELARTKPGALNFGSSGIGSTPHLSGELFKMYAKINMVHVPYKGAGAAVTDLMAGRLQLMLVSAPSVVSQIKAGRLRALAVTSAKRAAIMPELPTMDEAGVKGYEADVWWGLLAPAGTPRAIIDRINAVVVKGIKGPDIRQQFTRVGADVVGNSPAEFTKFLRNEVSKWSEVVRVSGAKAD